MVHLMFMEQVRIEHLIFAELVQATARVDVQVARFVNLAHLAR